MVEFPGLGHPYDGMNEKVGLDLLGRAQRELVMRAMHRVSCLKGHDLTPPEAGKLFSQLGWS